MSRPFLSVRPGLSMIELLLFIGIFAVVVSVILPLLMTSTESRLRQQTIALVEGNGTQVLQHLVRRTRNAERILVPARGATGAWLALQTASGGTHPTVFGTLTGSVVMIEGAAVQTVTSDQVAVTDFLVRNTSTSASEHSASVSFTVSRIIRLQAPHTYRRTFEALVTLGPVDTPQGNPCGCITPSCDGNVLTWATCPEDSCSTRTQMMDCS